MGLKIVLLPGLVCDEAVWRHAAAALGANAEVRIAHYGALDTLGAMAEKVLAETPGEFAIAGHSMGGRVAMEIMRRDSNRITGLALMDTGVTTLAMGEAGMREAAGRFELHDIAQKQGMKAMARRWVQGMVWPPRLAEPALIDAIVDMFARSSADIFYAQISALLSRPDATRLLNDIRCPTLVLCGADDAWAPAKRHVDMAERIRGATLTLVPECGHMCTMERPEAVTTALLAWRARL